MPLVLEYTNSRAEYLAHYEIAYANVYPAQEAKYRQGSYFWMGVLLFASWLAYQGGNFFLMCLLLVLAIYYLRDALMYSRKFWDGVEYSVALGREKYIRLEVREDGLHESELGVESFVPWPAVTSFTLHRDIAFIALANEHFAIVPRDSLRSGPAAFEELLRILRDKGIKELPNKALLRDVKSK